MAVFKCKMCGGTLEIKNNETVAVCEYCGTKQTLPKLDDDRKANLYDRANHFRRNNEFDKAMGIYEQILNEDSTDAESYWSLVLCRYGIEYVEDPATHKRIPTVNRAQYTSIFDDEDYKSALQYADGSQKEIYEAEAAAINEIQKGILAISGQEEPFDVFICYKETDHNGRRTLDSVLATELYHELTREGFKVFFSRITLEDKLGQEYEPYIFAALNSAKVMVVLGTKSEHFNAAWVKNEWNRYLTLIKNGAQKVLIPAFKDMEPYDLPEEFSHLQAQDMSKLGFIQDLVRGIKKIVGERPSKEQKTVKMSVETDFNSDMAIDKALLLIEDGNNVSACELLDRAFAVDPKNPMIYVGRLLVEKNIKTQDNLVLCSEPLENSSNYIKAVRFADPELKASLEKANETIKIRAKENIYIQAVNQLKRAKTSADCLNAKSLFEKIPRYKDTAAQIVLCDKKADAINKENVYTQAVSFLNKHFNDPKSEKDCAQQSIVLLSKIKEYKDAEDLIDKANRAVYDCDKRIAVKKKKKRIIISIVTILFVLVFSTVVVQQAIIIPRERYKEADVLFSEGKYEEAYKKYHAALFYSDAKEKAKECRYQQAVLLRNNQEWDKANAIFEKISDYKDSAELIHNHDWQLKDERAPSCTTDGYKKHVCTGCGSEKEDTVTAPGHSWKAATCTEPQKCTRCGKTSGSALGHTTDSAKCSRCGKITFKTITYSGTGSAVKSNINLPKGNFRITCTMTSGDTNMNMYFNYGNGTNDYGMSDDMIFNEYTAGASEITVISGPVSNGSITINANKSYNNTTMGWKITIEAIG